MKEKELNKNVDMGESKKHWFADHPLISIISYSILLAGAVFAFSKFCLIESIESNYQSQLETKQSVVDQYVTKVDLLEKDNQKLTEERDRYLDYLKALPNNVYFFEDKIVTLEDEIVKLNSVIESHTNISENPTEEKYICEYTDVKKSVAEVDSYTGTVVC